MARATRAGLDAQSDLKDRPTAPACPRPFVEPAVPPQVVFEEGRSEAEIDVTAGDEAGVFTIRAVPSRAGSAPFSAECRVTAGGAGPAEPSLLAVSGRA